MRKEVLEFIENVQKSFPDNKVTIDNVNDFYDVLETTKSCKNCKGLENCPNINKGFYMAFKDNQFYSVRCKYNAMYQNLNKNRILESEYNETDFNASIENYDTNTESRKKLVSLLNTFLDNYYDSFQKGLYIYGRFSIGKTYTLSVIASELRKKRISYVFIYFPDLVTELKSGMENGKYDKIIKYLKEVDVLLIDDFGAENMTPWLRDEVIGPIVNYRITTEKPIFISSNISPSDLKNHLMMNNSEDEKVKAGRIVSRLTSLVKSISIDDGDKYQR